VRLDRFQSERAALGSSDLDRPMTSSYAPLPSENPGSQDLHAQSPESATLPWADGTKAIPTAKRNDEPPRERTQIGHYRAMLAGVFPDIVEATRTPPAIGKYLVVGRFSGSGQAEVFRVVHPELRRDLVLKLAKRPIDDEGRSDVIMEGQRLAELEHTNIVRVHDLDFHEGRPYLVMEYIRGRTLGHYVREEPVSPVRAAALIAELSGAVAFAHHRGIVHQDIKPANVLIDEAGRPRLIDFGLSWQQDAWSGSSNGSEGGTFAYMAPEQARVELDRVRPLSDVFALGGLLYFLLTGRGPFEASTQEESWARARRCEFDPSALKKAGVPRRLARICLRAMAADPRSRFQSADALRVDLRRHLRLRLATPVLGAVAIGFALLVPALAFWPQAGRPPTYGPTWATAGRGNPAPSQRIRRDCG
jgi:serine/threonine protein kinase